jgi:dTMP kinase
VNAPCSARFLTFEGGEAAGKSTQIRILAGRLRASGRDVVELREPGGTPIGEKIRHLLKHDPDGHGMSPEAELLLMNASRAELVRKVIRPALADGRWVVSDRFFDSTTAYQGHGRGLDLDQVGAVVDIAVGPTRPDLTFYLDVDPATAQQRLSRRRGELTEADRFDEEKDAFFGRVRQGFGAILAAHPERVVPVDAGSDVDSVAAAVWNELVKRNWL